MTRRFLRMKAATYVALTVSLCCVLACPLAQGQYAHTSGEQIVDAQGHEIHLRGTNLGNWMVPEGYMCAIQRPCAIGA